MRCVKKTWANAKIDIVTKFDMHELVESNPNINKKYYLKKSDRFSGFFKLINKLKQNKYELVIDAHAVLRSKIIRMMLNAPQYTVLNKKTFRRELLIKFKINLLKKRKRILEEYINPLHKLGVKYDGKGTELFIPEIILRKTKNILKGKEKIIGIAPGASFANKIYPHENFKQIAMKILEGTDYNIILFGGKQDKKLNIKGYENRIVDLQGNTSFIESASAASFCKVVLANDSFMVHASEAVGTNVIAFFGPTVKEFGYFPYRKNSIVFEVDIKCRPCSKHGKKACSKKEKYCLTKIDPNIVFKRIKSITDNQTEN